MVMDGRGEDRTMRRRTALRMGALAAVTVGSAGCLGMGGPSPEEQVNEQSDAWEKYTSLETALKDGYRGTSTYQTTEEGIVGEALVNYEADISTDQPQVLLYNLTDDGQYELVGGEWYAPVEDTDSAPSLFGKTFDGPVAATRGLPKRYILRAWFASENEDTFARANPSLSAPAYASTLSESRTALETLLTGNDAQKSGYQNTEKCIALDAGGYGVPFVRKSDGPTTDLTKPPILIYRLTSNWNYLLMGAEWWVEAGASPQEIFGAPWHDSMPAHSPKVDRPDHRGLHAWLFRPNPAGMFATTHPLVSCE